MTVPAWQMEKGGWLYCPQLVGTLISCVIIRPWKIGWQYSITTSPSGSRKRNGHLESHWQHGEGCGTSTRRLVQSLGSHLICVSKHYYILPSFLLFCLHPLGQSWWRILIRFFRKDVCMPSGEPYHPLEMLPGEGMAEDTSCVIPTLLPPIYTVNELLPKTHTCTHHTAPRTHPHSTAP